MDEEMCPKPGPKDLAFALFPSLLSSPGLVALTCHLLLLWCRDKDFSVSHHLSQFKLLLWDAYSQKNPPRPIPGSCLLPLMLDP